MVTGLAPDTTYHYRLVSDNSVEGIGDGADATFSTAADATPPPAGGPAPPTTTNPGESAMATEKANGRRQRAGAGREGGHEQGPDAAGDHQGPHPLQAERREGGKFICTAASGCTSIWTPLTVAAGVIRKGPVKLGTIRRPEGTVQVTYKGHPLYTFASDKKPGQTKGEGIKDVGTWHASLLPTKGGGPGSTPVTPPHTYLQEVSK